MRRHHRDYQTGTVAYYDCYPDVPCLGQHVLVLTEAELRARDVRIIRAAFERWIGVGSLNGLEIDRVLAAAEADQKETP